MRVLYLDIETFPNEVYAWNLFKTTIGVEMIKNPAYILCWGAKWENNPEVYWEDCQIGQLDMLRRIHDMIDAADVIVHFNGQSFDMPWLTGQFIQHDMLPPSPYKQIDLFRVVQKLTYYPSNRLAYVSRVLQIGEKVKHEGFDLWLACHHGDAAAWERMQKYNIQDVLLLEEAYKRLQPWIPHHPNRAEPGTLGCPSCGCERLIRRGYYVAKTVTYQRYRCSKCGAWSRGVTSKGMPRQVVTGV